MFVLIFFRNLHFLAKISVPYFCVYFLEAAKETGFFNGRVIKALTRRPFEFKKVFFLVFTKRGGGGKGLFTKNFFFYFMYFFFFFF